MEQEENIQLVNHSPEDYENLQLAKYWRSKSLPVVYMPPQPTTLPPLRMMMHHQQEPNYYESVSPPIQQTYPTHSDHLHHGKPPLAEIRESSEDSDGRGGTRNSSIRSDNTNNTLLTNVTNEKLGANRMREGSNSSGQVSFSPKINHEFKCR